MNTLLAIVWIHWIADFVLQTNQMAQNKSKSNYWLGYHVVVYSLSFIIFGWKYAAINGAAHFVVDWFTSRINSKLWTEKRVHAFFVGVGVDQAIHMTILFYTAKCMLHV